jgi:hypothetical protein
MTKWKIGSVLLAALVLALVPVAAVAMSASHPHVPWMLIGMSLFGIAGTVTVTYAYPVAGTTPPTLIQSSQVNVVTASVNFADGDTTAPVTHNLAVGTAAPNPLNTAGLFPEVSVYWSTAGMAFPALAVALTSGNVITLSKGNTAAGSGGTAVVVIRRPGSPGQ